MFEASAPSHPPQSHQLWLLWLVPLLGLALVAVAVIGSSLRSSAEQSASQASHDRAYDILVASERVISSLADAQRGERGFLLTGNDDFLAPFHAGSANARRNLKRLSELAAPDSTQRPRIIELRRLIEEALTFYGNTIQLGRTGQREAAIALVRSGEGKALMDRARLIADAIIQQDEEILRRERAQAESASDAGSRMTYVVAAAGAGLLILSILAIALAVRRTKDAQSTAALAQHASALELALETQEALLYEVNHRVKNSLQVVMSLLYLQANQIRDPEARQALVDARARVNVIASIHQSLYKHGTHTEVELCSYLGALASSTVSSLDAAQRLDVDVRCSTEITLPIQQAVPLALILAELLTNSIKYAFPDEARGQILVEAEPQGSNLCVVVSDNGRGLPPHFDPTRSTGVGMRIIGALAKQLRGKMEVLQRERGAAFAFSLPVELS